MTARLVRQGPAKTDSSSRGLVARIGTNAPKEWIRVAFGTDVNSHDVTEWRVKDLAALVRLLNEHRSGPLGGPYVCAAAMRNGIRNAVNAEPTRVVFIDFDKLDQAAAKALPSALVGIACAWWRTRKSTRERPRRRIVVLIDREIDPSDYPRVHAALVAELSKRTGVDLVADPTSANPAQPEFTPVLGSRIHVVRGKPFAVPPAEGTSDPVPGGTGQLKFETDKSRNVDLTSLAGWMRFKGCTTEQIHAALVGVNKTLCEPLKAREIRGIARSVGRYQPGEALAELVIKPLSEIPVEKLEPLWPGKLWLGKVTIVAGLMGLGKSTLLFDIAARVTTGAEWPDHSGKAPVGDVVILSTEDDAADTIRPRMEMMGADISRVHILEGVKEIDAKTKRNGRRLFSLRQHLDLLDQKLAELKDVKLVIIDPITGVFQGTDTHKTADVREVLAMLGTVVERHHAAFVGISHPNKAEGTSAAYRITGSVAFTAAPRSAFIVGRSPDPNTPDRIIFAELKNNLAAKQGSLAFRVVAKTHPVAGSAATIEWLGAAHETPDDILDPVKSGRARAVEDSTKTATEWLKEILSKAPTPSRWIETAAREKRISRRQLDRAAKELKVIKRPLGRGGAWMWSLPPSKPE